jgi:rhodanese-related sulfurtransferase
MARTLSEMIATATQAVRGISPADAAVALEAGDFAAVVDVREPGEYQELHVAGSICIPRGLLELRADPASPGADAALAGNRSGRILLYCTKGPGARSLLAGETLTTMGFDQVEVLTGGLSAWSEAGLAVEGTSQTPETTS